MKFDQEYTRNGSGQRAETDANVGKSRVKTN